MTSAIRSARSDARKALAVACVGRATLASAMGRRALAATMLALACAPGANPPVSSPAPVSLAPTGVTEPSPAALPPRRTSPATVFVGALPLLPAPCRTLRDAVRSGSEAVRYDELERCLTEHALALPLACFDEKRWTTGAACRAGTPAPVACGIEGAAEVWLPDVAVSAGDPRPVFVTGGEEIPDWRLEPAPQDGSGLDVEAPLTAAITAAIERDIAAPAPAFLIRQVVDRAFTGPGATDRLVNVRVVGLTLPGSGGSLTERHALYLLSGGAAPLLLRATSGDRATAAFNVLATLDLDGDGRYELVLKTDDYSAPVEVALLEVDGGRVTQRAAWSCASGGLESGRP
jgi:hypothetical protein